MKTTVTVNLNGRVFTMDQDAFHLLDNYLKNLRVFFKQEKDASEILADFESRIEELLSEKLRLGYQVITIKDVEEVIARVGTLEELSEEAADSDRISGGEYTRQEGPVKKKLYRNTDDQLFGGVCSGIAAYFNWDAVVVRLLFIVFAFVTSFVLIPIYLLAWLIIPAAVTAEQKLQMRGEPITVENIGKKVSEDATKTETSSSGKQNFGTILLQVFVVIIKVLAIAIGCVLLFPLLIVVFALVVVILALFGVSSALFTLPFSFPFWDESIAPLSESGSIWMMLLVILTFGIPVGILFYHILAHFIKSKPVSATVKWIIAIIWIVSLVTLIVLGGRKFSDPHFFVTKSFVHYGDNEDILIGNGILHEQEWIISQPVNELDLQKNLWATVQIEPTTSDSTRILLNGDENLIAHINYQVLEDKLLLSTTDGIKFGDNNLIIRIQTPHLQAIRSGSLGNLNIFNKFAGEKLDVSIMGAGRFQADSIYVDRFSFRADGVSSAQIKGKVRSASLKAEAVGGVNASELQADTVIARMQGVGSITCYPIEHLDAKLDGVGTIKYKNVPKSKVTATTGVGSIKHE